MTLSDSRRCRRLEATLRPLPSLRTGLPRLPESSFRRAVPTTPADRAGAHVDCFPAHAAFPLWQEGRHPHCHFRGLLRLHSCYGPPDRSAAQRRPLSRGSNPCSCPHEPLVQLPDQSTTLRVDSSSTDDSRLRGALPFADSCMQHTTTSFDHLVGASEQWERHGEPKRLRHLEVDDEPVLVSALNWQFDGIEDGAVA